MTMYFAYGNCAVYLVVICSAFLLLWSLTQTVLRDSGPLRKHAYSNILEILLANKENFQIKNSDIFHISAPNIDCGYSLEPPQRGGSNEYPQSMFF